MHFTENIRGISSQMVEMTKQINESMRPWADITKRIEESMRPWVEMKKRIDESMKPVQEMAKRISESMEPLTILRKSINNSPFVRDVHDELRKIHQTYAQFYKPVELFTKSHLSTGIQIKPELVHRPIPVESCSVKKISAKRKVFDLVDDKVVYLNQPIEFNKRNSLTELLLRALLLFTNEDSVCFYERIEKYFVGNGIKPEPDRRKSIKRIHNACADLFRSKNRRRLVIKNTVNGERLIKPRWGEGLVFNNPEL